MAGERLYNRKARLTLARPLKAGDAWEFFTLQPNAIEINDLRIAFSIEKSLPSEPNTAQIIVTNLAAQTRAELDRKPLKVILDVGYDGELQTLFRGDLRWSFSSRTSTDWNTDIHCGDGERAYRFARVKRSFKPGTALKTVLGDVVGSMGLKLPKNVSEARELTTQLVSGAVVNGPSQLELTRMLGAAGYGWSVQDEQLQVLKQGEALVRQALLISQATGLIGSPTFSAPQDNSKAPTLNLDTLLNPAIRPGALVFVDSKTVSGQFRVEKVVHTGDTYGSDWKSHVEAKAAR